MKSVTHKVSKSNDKNRNHWIHAISKFWIHSQTVNLYGKVSKVRFPIRPRRIEVFYELLAGFFGITDCKFPVLQSLELDSTATEKCQQRWPESVRYILVYLFAYLFYLFIYLRTRGSTATRETDMHTHTNTNMRHLSYEQILYIHLYSPYNGSK